MCQECYDVAWQIVFSDLWKKNIFELVEHKKERIESLCFIDDALW